MEKAKRLLSKITGSILVVTLILSICITSGLLTTSAAALSVGEKVIDLASAKFGDSNSVKVSGEMSTGATISASSRFDSMNGIGVIGTQQKVAAGDKFLAASFVGSEFGDIGSKIFNSATKKLIGDGIKITVYIPSYATSTTFGMHLNLVNDEGKSEEYFCEKDLEKGRKHDVYLKYTDFKRLATDDDYQQYNEYGTRILPDPENYTATLPKYVGMSDYGYFGSFEYHYDQIKYGSFYVRSSSESEAGVLPAFYASDATIYENAKESKYFLKWKDGDIKMNGDHVFAAGDIPFDREYGDFSAPNGSIHVTGTRTLHKDAFYINPVTGQKVEMCDQNPKTFAIYNTTYDKNLADYDIDKEGLQFQIKQPLACNVGLYSGSYSFGIGLLVNNPDDGTMKWYVFNKIIAQSDLAIQDDAGNIIDIDTLTVRAPLKNFKTDDNELEAITQEDLKNVTKMKITARSEYYWDAVMNLDMQISDIYRYQGRDFTIPTPAPVDPEKVYDPEPDDSTTPPDPGSTTGTTTIKPSESDKTTTTIKPTTTTTKTTAKPVVTTTTTVTTTTAKTEEPTTTINTDNENILENNDMGFKITAVKSDGIPFEDGLQLLVKQADNDFAKGVRNSIESESDYYSLLELYDISFARNGMETTVDGKVKISIQMSPEMMALDTKFFIRHLLEDGTSETLEANVEGDMLTFETESCSYFAIVADSGNDTGAPAEPSTDNSGTDESKNPSTGSAAPIALAVITGIAGMAIFFAKKKDR